MIGLRRAFESTLKVDSRLIAPVTGAITALPVVAIFAIGLGFGSASAAISMAIGANLIAIESLVGAPRLPIRLAVSDALLLGVSAFAGTITSPYPWLHIVVLIPWCFGAGMLVELGPIESVIGTQAIIAFVVLGRFAGTPHNALHLALLVTLGALVEILALFILRLPPSLRFQRNQLADALDLLAMLSERDPNIATSDVASALDRCEHALSTASLFGRIDVADLRSVLDQAQRMRLEFTTVAGLRARLSGVDAAYARSAIATCLKNAGTALEGIAEKLRHSTQPMSWRTAATQYENALRSLETSFGHGDSEIQIIALQCMDYLAALGGQIRAAGNLVDNLGAAARRVVWHLHVATPRRPDLGRLKTDVAILMENFHKDSSSFRHAVRLAFAVPFSSLIAIWLSLPRGYWLPFAVAVILRPDYGSLFGKGLGRVVGTLVGATLGAVLVSELHPGLVLTTVLVAITAWITYSMWTANFAVAIGAMTALVLILLNTSLHDTTSTALDRLIDISLGGAIAMVVYLVWPTSPRAAVSQDLSSLYEALGGYLTLVLDLMETKSVEPAQLNAVSGVVRRAWTTAQATVGRSMQEPSSTRIDPSEGQGLLAVAVRIVRAMHAMRIEAERGATIAAFDEFDMLRRGLLQGLSALADLFSGRPAHLVPDLRQLYRAVERVLTDSGAPPSVAVHLDELVNAIDTAAHLAGGETRLNEKGQSQ